jgi:GPH family glycoside/pentoside/hexuronide:cation symporter
MSEQVLATQPHGVAVTDVQRLSFKEKLSYGLGEVGANLCWNMLTGFLVYYYTDIALLPIAAVGPLILGTRILDAIADPVVGILVDRTSTRHGRARPYVAIASIPFGILLVLTFAVPALEPAARIAYAYVTFGLAGLAYSFLHIPYGALMPMMTRHPADKLELSSYRSMGTSLGSIIVYSLVMPIVTSFGSGPQSAKHGFTAAAVLFASIGVALSLVVFANCKERHVIYGSRTHGRLTQNLRELLRNRLWLIAIALGLLMFIRIGVMVSDATYFAKNILGQLSAVSVMLPLLSVAILCGGLIAPWYFKQLGIRGGNVLALLVSMVLQLLLFPAVGNFPVFLAIFMLANVSIGLCTATLFVLISDAVELQEETFGTRSEGLVASSVSFGMKVGMALGAAFAAWALSWAGYDPAALTQSARSMIAALFYWIPIFAMGLQAVSVAFYRAPSARNIPAAKIA